MKKLHVGESLAWPPELAAEATGLLGTRGAGKSNLARVIVEECYSAGVPCVIFDPIGNWYGLRAGRDGKPAGGLPFVIFGGPHGDVPLEPTKGAELADTVVDVRLNCILDLSHPDLSENDKRRFLRDFGDRLFRKKQGETGWMLLVFEEVDDYAPQSPRGEQAFTLAVFQKLVKRGRFKGLGALLVTQRSASVNKDLLNMIGTLVAFRTPAPRDRDAIADWMKHHSVAAEAVSTLHELKPGEAWVWSPELLGTLERVRFRRMETYDTGATPKHVDGAAARKPATLADVDIPALRERFKTAIEKAKAEDPKELKRTIADLKRQLDSMRFQAVGQSKRAQTAEKRVAVPVLKAAQVKRLEAVAARIDRAMVQLGKWAQLFTGTEREVRNVGAEILAALAAARDTRDTQRPGGGVVHVVGDERSRPAVPSRPAPVVYTRKSGDGDARVSRPQQDILDAVAYFETIAVPAPSRRQVALVAKVSSVSSGYERNISTLRTAGLLDYPGPNLLALTPEGRASARAPEVPPTMEELWRTLYARVSNPQASILSALIAAYPQKLTREELAARSHQSETSSGFEKNISTLKSVGLIHYPAPGYVAALPVLFLEGA